MNVSQTILFLALSGASSAALAADAESTPPAPSVFVKKAALDGMTEVEAGKVALSKSQDPAIRDFAQRMVNDHGKANSELESLAMRKGLTPPKQLDAEHKEMLDALTSKNGQGLRPGVRGTHEHGSLEGHRAVRERRRIQ